MIKVKPNYEEIYKEVKGLLKDFKLSAEFNDYPQTKAEILIFHLDNTYGNLWFRVCSDKFIMLHIDGNFIENRNQLNKFRADLATLDKIAQILEKNGYEVGI